MAIPIKQVPHKQQAAKPAFAGRFWLFNQLMQLK
jgi:hypothetical protein